MLKRLREKLYQSIFFNQLKIQKTRDQWVLSKLNLIQSGNLILDAGCGSQRYKNACLHLVYKAQDFGKYETDEVQSIEDSIGGEVKYEYGPIDYVGNIWEISERDHLFDAILCTEVLEHVPYPNETIKEFSRLLKKNGVLILTAPTHSLKHMDPYHFYTGFTDRWYEHILNKFGFEILEITPVSDYFRVLALELARLASMKGVLGASLLFPAFIYAYFQPQSRASVASLCYGHHIFARLR